jgi:immune inhibitor A
MDIIASRFTIMPPPASLAASLEFEWRRILTKDRESVNCRGIVRLAVLLALVMAAAPVRAERVEVPVLVVLAQFPDRPLTRAREEFAGTPEALIDRLVAYYDEVSSGRLRIQAHVGEPIVTLPGPRASYVQRPGALAGEALEAFAASVQRSEDRVALDRSAAAIVFFAGTGRESHVGAPPHDDPWSNYTGLTHPVGGIDEAMVIAEHEVEPFSSFGVLCHEFGHLLGVPELYAPGAAEHEGIGVWGLMGQGTWIGRGDRPPHPSAWTKLRLGWVDARVVTESTRRVRLPAVEIEPSVVKIPLGSDPREYLLLENRARVGADARLPGEGVLVWHVDESRSSFRWAQMKPQRKLLHLVEADGRGDLDRGHARGGNRGDATDPWRGIGRGRRLAGPLLAVAGALALAGAVLRLGCVAAPGAVLLRVLIAAVLLGGGALALRAPVCGPGHPGMAPYAGSPGRIVLRNFSPAGREMFVDVIVLPSLAPPAAAGTPPDRPLR